TSAVVVQPPSRMAAPAMERNALLLKNLITPRSLYESRSLLVPWQWWGPGDRTNVRSARERRSRDIVAHSEHAKPSWTLGEASRLRRGLRRPLRRRRLSRVRTRHTRGTSASASRFALAGAESPGRILRDARLPARLVGRRRRARPPPARHRDVGEGGRSGPARLRLSHGAARR